MLHLPIPLGTRAAVQKQAIDEESSLAADLLLAFHIQSHTMSRQASGTSFTSGADAAGVEEPQAKDTETNTDVTSDPPDMKKEVHISKAPSSKAAKKKVELQAATALEADLLRYLQGKMKGPTVADYATALPSLLGRIGKGTDTITTKTEMMNLLKKQAGSLREAARGKRERTLVNHLLDLTGLCWGQGGVLVVRSDLPAKKKPTTATKPSATPTKQQQQQAQKRQRTPPLQPDQPEKRRRARIDATGPDQAVDEDSSLAADLLLAFHKKSHSAAPHVNLRPMSPRTQSPAGKREAKQSLPAPVVVDKPEVDKQTQATPEVPPLTSPVAVSARKVEAQVKNPTSQTDNDTAPPMPPRQSPRSTDTARGSEPQVKKPVLLKESDVASQALTQVSPNLQSDPTSELQGGKEAKKKPIGRPRKKTYNFPRLSRSTLPLAPPTAAGPTAMLATKREKVPAVTPSTGGTVVTPGGIHKQLTGVEADLLRYLKATIKASTAFDYLAALPGLLSRIGKSTDTVTTTSAMKDILKKHSVQLRLDAGGKRERTLVNHLLELTGLCWGPGGTVAPKGSLTKPVPAPPVSMAQQQQDEGEREEEDQKVYKRKVDAPLVSGEPKEKRRRR